jgi:hypothetical protein
MRLTTLKSSPCTPEETGKADTVFNGTLATGVALLTELVGPCRALSFFVAISPLFFPFDLRKRRCTPEQHEALFHTDGAERVGVR